MMVMRGTTMNGVRGRGLGFLLIWGGIVVLPPPLCVLVVMTMVAMTMVAVTMVGMAVVDGGLDGLDRISIGSPIRSHMDSLVLNHNTTIGQLHGGCQNGSSHKGSSSK